MNKGKLKKILATGAMGIMALAMPFTLTGCDKDSDINVRINGDYVQWQVEGEDSWTNLLTIDEILNAIGDDIKGEQGIAGKQIEFDKTSTHIVWRYVGDADWKILIAFTDLKQEDEVVDKEELHQRGFELFQSKLNNMNSNYKVSYEYADDYIVESFLYCNAYLPRLDGNPSLGRPALWGSNVLNMFASIEYDYQTTASYPELNIDKWRPYTLNIVGQSCFGKTATNSYLGLCKYINDIKDYEVMFTGGKINYMPSIYSNPKNFDHNFVKNLKKFNIEDVINCKFNDTGDCILSLGYSGTYSSRYPYLKSDYIYDFYINSNGEILKCYVYEKDFLNKEIKGNVYCKISYEKDQSLISNDLINAAFESYIEALERLYPDNTPECIDWYDVFKYEDLN